MKNYEIAGLAIFLILFVLPSIPTIFIFGRLRRSKKKELQKPFLISLTATILFYTVVVIDAYLIEPNWPILTKIQLKSNLKKPLKILHLSDLRLEAQMASRDQWLLEQLQKISPDIILITGNTHQFKMKNAKALKRILKLFKAPLGVYCCVGYDDIRLLKPANKNIVYLINKTIFVKHGKQKIAIAGLAYFGKRERAYSRLVQADYKIAMNHTPDLADEVSTYEIDLYLCGHTLGGQISLPFWGAITTHSESGKKYEAGLYKNRKTWIYTSRGLGLLPRPTPQVRFLCRPEITLITIEAKQSEKGK